MFWVSLFVAVEAGVSAPYLLHKPLLFESFQDETWRSRWKLSKAANASGKWVFKETTAPQLFPGEKMIFTDSENSYFGLSRPLDEILDLKNKTLIIQYETRFLGGMDCGGAYIKLFGKNEYDADTLCNETKYVLMFGPDRCADTNKVHFIFRHRNPIDGSVVEKALRDAPKMKNDKNNHLYTLIVRPDNSYEILIDGERAKAGNMMSDFTPGIIPPKEIDDPEDKKPKDWVDIEWIPDPNAKKPASWDENAPEYIPDPRKLNPPADWLLDVPPYIEDPDAQKPDDWDTELLGYWEPPTIENPKCKYVSGCGDYEPPMIKNQNYKGKWTPPKIKNPEFKGHWKPRQIPNPTYFEDYEPYNFPDVTAVGFELWMVNKNVGFSNVYIGHDEEALKKWNQEHYVPKHKHQVNERIRIDEEQRKKDQAEIDALSKPIKKTENAKKQANNTDYEAALKEFGKVIQKEWDILYKQNPEATIFVSVAAALIILMLILFVCCCRDGSEKAAKKRKEARKKKDDEILEAMIAKEYKKLKQEQEQATHRTAKKTE